MAKIIDQIYYIASYEKVQEITKPCFVEFQHMNRGREVNWLNKFKNIVACNYYYVCSMTDYNIFQIYPQLWFVIDNGKLLINPDCKDLINWQNDIEKNIIEIREYLLKCEKLLKQANDQMVLTKQGNVH